MPAAPVIWCLLSAALFGASTPLSKWLLGDLGVFALAGLLYLGAAVAMAPFSFRGGSAERRRHPRHVGYLIGAILFGGVAGPVLLLLGLQVAKAASVALWLNMELVATALLAAVLFREHLGARTISATALVVGAGVLLAAPEGFGDARAAALVAGACLCWGLDNNFTALIDGYTDAQTTAIKGVAAGCVNLGIGLGLGEVSVDVAVIGIALAVGAVSYGVSIALYIRGAHHLGATRAQVLFSTAPLVGVVLAWTALGEAVLPVQLGAAALMLAGVVVLIRSEHGHEHTHDELTHTHSHRHDDGHHTHVHPGLPAWVRHTHQHEHEPVRHSHPHVPDLHHRHGH